MTKNVVIRKCREDEIPQIGHFYDSVVLYLDNHVNYPRWIIGVYPSEHSVRLMAEAGSQYVCFKGDTIIGAFAMNNEPQGSYQKGEWSQNLRNGEYMVIHAMAVSPAMQRQGTGSEIIRFCVDKAKSEAYKAIRVDIVPTNYPARLLFENNGFDYAGDTDLGLKIGDIPAFSLYEFTLQDDNERRGKS